jgi:FMN phosphatase YigB (HAD superfamily)
MITTLLFDFGGTLDTDGVHWSERFWDVYRQLDVPVTKAAYEAAYVNAESQIAHFPPDSSQTLAESLRKQVHYQLLHLRSSSSLSEDCDLELLGLGIAGACYDGVWKSIAAFKPMLLSFRKGYRLGMVSNFTGNLVTVCRELGIDEIFSAIVDSAVIGVSKPDPEIFRIACRDLDSAPYECLVVGDSYERDVVPSKEIGCRTVWLHGRSWKEPVNTPSADYIINSLQALPELVQKIRTRP